MSRKEMQKKEKENMGRRKEEGHWEIDGPTKIMIFCLIFYFVFGVGHGENQFV
jgi:hypothetical protein